MKYLNLYLQVLKTQLEHRLGAQAIEMEHALHLQNVQTKADSRQDRVLEGTYYSTSTVLQNRRTVLRIMLQTPIVFL